MAHPARTIAGGQFVRRVELPDPPPQDGGYPFDLPVVKSLQASDGLDLAPGVTFLVGDNGSGKSTLVEAIAVAAGFNPEGGSRSFRFATRSTESTLGGHLRLVRGAARERTCFFLRAESFYNVLTEIEALEDADPGLLDAYGGQTLHSRSHGESFIELLHQRFRPGGLYIMDEPEAALSTHGLLVVLRRIHDLVRADSQFLIATHSPVLLAVPGAKIVEIGLDGTLAPVEYDDAEPVTLTRAFLDAPERMLRHLLDD
ncbi:MAG: AAA family ATPase [Solirubrobacteraceae bacterium]